MTTPVSSSTHFSSIQKQPSTQAGRGNAVRFGSHDFKNQFVQKAIPISKAATEVYLINFFYQDVLSIWLPRTGISLKTGRTPYDPNQDPDAQNLSWFERKKRSLTKNIEGLNWVNFNEESKRETATGPGTLAVPASLFILNRYLGNISRELSFPALQNFSAGFKKSLSSIQNAPPTLPYPARGKGTSHFEMNKTLPSGYQGDVSPFKKGSSVETPLNHQDYQKAVGHYITQLFADPELKRQHGAFLNSWGQRYAAVLFKEMEKPKWQRFKESVTHFGTSKNHQTPMEQLAQELKQVVIPFNRDHRILAYTDPHNPLIHDNKPLHRLEYTWVNYHRLSPDASATSHYEPKEHLHQMPLSQLLEDLSRSGGYFKALWKDSKGTRENGSIAVKQLADNTETTMKRLVKTKFLLGMGVTILSILYLLRLAFWSQSNDKYQATRLLRQEYVENAL